MSKSRFHHQKSALFLTATSAALALSAACSDDEPADCRCPSVTGTQGSGGKSGTGGTSSGSGGTVDATATAGSGGSGTAGSAGNGNAGSTGTDPVVDSAQRMIEEGRQTFRYDTFGD